MHLTELVLQGVRGFLSPRKLVFKPGFNVVWGQAGSGKTTIQDVLLDLFYHRPIDQTRPFFQSSNGQGPSRAGMTLQTGEKVYRKVVDFVQGSEILSRSNPDQSAFETLLQDSGQIEDFFRREIKMPSREAFMILLLIVEREFPSKSAMSHRPSISSPNLSAVQDPAVLQREIQSLRKLRENALKIKQMQFDLDGIHKEIFESADIFKREGKLQEQIANIRKELDPLGKLPEIPDDLEARADEYDRASRKLQADLPSLNREIHEIKEELAFVTPDPLEKDAQFLAGVVLFVAAIVLAILSVGEVQFFGMSIRAFQTVLGVVALGSMGTAGYRLYNFVSAKERRDHLAREFQNKSEKLKKMERKFEVETSVVRNIMKAVNADSVREMYTSIHKAQELQKTLSEAEKELTKEKSRPEYLRAKERLPEMKKQATVIEQDLHLLSATPLDSDVLEDQIAQLEDQLRKSGSATDFSADKKERDLLEEIPREFIEKVGRDLFYHPTHRLIAVSAQSLQISMEEFLKKLLPPLEKNIVAFSFKNFSEPRIDTDGTFSIIEVSTNTRVRFEQLESFKQDLIYFSLKFTLLQFFLREYPLPLIMDAPFSSFDDRVAPVIAKSLKFLSQQSQIIFLTSREVYIQGADHVEKL